MPRKTLAQKSKEFVARHQGSLFCAGVQAPSNAKWTIVALPPQIAALVSPGGIDHRDWLRLQEDHFDALSRNPKASYMLRLPTPLYEKDEHCSHCGFDLKADALCKIAKIPIQGGDCANAECPESKGFIPEIKTVDGAVPGQIVVQMNYDSTGLNEDWRNVKEDFNPTGDRRRRRMPREWEVKHNNGRLSINPLSGFTILEDYDETLRQWNLELQAEEIAQAKAAATTSQIRQTIVMDARPKKQTRRLPPLRGNNRRNTDQVTAEVEGLDEVPVETSLEDELAKFQAENQIR